MRRTDTADADAMMTSIQTIIAGYQQGRRAALPVPLTPPAAHDHALPPLRKLSSKVGMSAPARLA